MNQITLSQNIFTGIAKIAQELDLSVNQLLEQINQGKLTIIDTEELEDLIDFRDAVIVQSDPENRQRIPWHEVKQDLNL